MTAVDHSVYLLQLFMFSCCAVFFDFYIFAFKMSPSVFSCNFSNLSTEVSILHVRTNENPNLARMYGTLFVRSSYTGCTKFFTRTFSNLNDDTYKCMMWWSYVRSHLCLSTSGLSRLTRDFFSLKYHESNMCALQSLKRLMIVYHEPSLSGIGRISI